MRIPTYVHRLAAAYLRHRSFARTERMIRSLPSEVQKDIGWPDAADERVHVLPLRAL